MTKKIGHNNYQKKMGFPQGLCGAFAPKSPRTISMSDKPKDFGNPQPAVKKGSY